MHAHLFCLALLSAIPAACHAADATATNTPTRTLTLEEAKRMSLRDHP